MTKDEYKAKILDFIYSEISVSLSSNAPSLTMIVNAVEHPTENSVPQAVDIISMSEGNPGAISVLVRTLNNYTDLFDDVINYLFHKDVYGSKIWVLYKDVCGENLGEFVNVCTG